MAFGLMAFGVMEWSLPHDIGIRGNAIQGFGPFGNIGFRVIAIGFMTFVVMG